MRFLISLPFPLLTTRGRRSLPFTKDWKLIHLANAWGRRKCAGLQRGLQTISSWEAMKSARSKR